MCYKPKKNYEPRSNIRYKVVRHWTSDYGYCGYSNLFKYSDLRTLPDTICTALSTRKD